MCAGSLAELDSVGVDMGNSSNKCQGRGISQGRDSDSLKVAVCLGSYHRPIYRSVVATLLSSQSERQIRLVPLMDFLVVFNCCIRRHQNDKMHTGVKESPHKAVRIIFLFLNL